MEAYTWKEKTEDGPMLFRATHHAGRWTLETCPKVGRALKDEVKWEVVEMNKDHYTTLRTLVWNKYQRKRVPWEWIEAIDKILEDMDKED